ncbi:hypothetical protein [Plebeiibacterium sediminum]|uniref:Uncharacterized protein n=1 Tax=Plebeiibacterium sediminum TaxID=2992112 RepID=A0AAE3M164_9BACT|nr:hypothetical protein [Plebeiobacterium sediminum]MCW3784870.1 hypothetical protein [Plebeiobacterium sediminum]
MLSKKSFNLPFLYLNKWILIIPNYRQSFLIVTVAIHLLVTGSTDAQELSYTNKKEYFEYNKSALQDSLKQFDIKLPFMIGKLHKSTGTQTRHPYYDNDWTDGEITYNNQKFHVQNLRYDILDDKLIYLLSSTDYKIHSIALDENFIKEFNILNKTFRYYTNLTYKNGKKISDSYYEIVYDGTMKFMIHKSKYKAIVTDWPYYNYTTITEMYLMINSIVFPIKNKSDLLNQLTDKKKELKKFISTNHLIVNKNQYESTTQILEYYENNKP